MATEERKHTTLSTVATGVSDGIKGAGLAMLALPAIVGIVAGGIAALTPIGVAGALLIGGGAALVTGVAELFSAPVIVGATTVGGLAGMARGINRAGRESHAYEKGMAREARQDQREMMQDAAIAQAQFQNISAERAVSDALQLRDAQWAQYFSQVNNEHAKGGHAERHRPEGAHVGDKLHEHHAAAKHAPASVA